MTDIVNDHFNKTVRLNYTNHRGKYNEGNYIGGSVSHMGPIKNDFGGVMIFTP